MEGVEPARGPALAILWALVAAAVVASLLNGVSGDAATLVETTTTPAASMAGTISIYKRTLTSADPYADAAFLRDGLGVDAIVAERTLDASGRLCAERAASSTLDGFQVHFFRSYVTPGADAAAADFGSLYDGERLGDRLPALTLSPRRRRRRRRR